MRPIHFSHNKCCRRSLLPVLGLAILLLVSLASPASSCTELEKTSLLQFLVGLSQDSGLSKSWREGTDCCNWEGVACNRNRAVTHVSLPSRGLEGHISPDLGNLSSLQYLNLSYNSLSGGLPLVLVSSSSIVVLDISFNELSGDLHDLPSSTLGQPLQVLNISSNLFRGQFTSTWKGMQNLIALNASNNSFTGPIPGHFCNISPSLDVLELCYNKLSGSIPPMLGNCSKLKVLKAGHNHLSGRLPDELFNATFLEHLSFPSNSLQGLLNCTHIAKLTNLVILDLEENNFSGKVPGSIIYLKRLQELHLGYNNMSGELPPTLGNCTNLTTIDLKSNNFSGELNKVNFSNLYNLKILDLRQNNFSGKIPESMYTCRNLTALRLAYNKFHGQLSEGLGNLKSLTFLSLTGNSFINLTNALQILKSSRNLTTLFIGRNFMSETISSCTEQEKASLLQFLTGLSKNSGLAKSWQKGTDCCKWEGVTCNGKKTVTQVSLPSRGLEGTITSLGNLTGLQHLNLSYNSLSGDLPLELVSSSSIIVLDISFNQISGDLHDLPSSTSGQPLKVLNISSNLFTGQFASTTWKGMENLVVLNASNNSFSGQIPSHFCNISPNFSVLELCYNNLSGGIPTGLSNCPKLKVLKAGHNHLSGPLPNELFNATLLEHLSFSSNSLHGILEGTHIAKLTNLVILDLGENNFSGKIPDSIVHLKRLEELHLGYNNMSGELPSILSNCTNLTTIDFNSNNFSGELNKVNFSNLSNLKILDFMQNNFSGKIPESIYSCRNLTALRLSDNKFHGQLSEGLGNLKSLTFLSLAGNSFTNLSNALQILKSSRKLTTLFIGSNFNNETMPYDDSIAGFENLQVLAIEHCLLLGKVPLWISKIVKLEALSLQGNQLSGPIPTWINTLNYLFYLDLSNNSLTWDIPKELMNMPMLTSGNTAADLDPRIFELTVYSGPSLQYRIPIAFPKVLYLNSNRLTGVIPQEIGQLNALLSLDISSNNITGPIPPSICNLTNLLVLDLSNNNLTGRIPAALENMHFLSTFNISNNDLEGPIPTGGQFSTFQNSSFDGNPKLCGPMFIRNCTSVKASPAHFGSSGLGGGDIFFVAAFVVFFGVGVLYDQTILSKFFGK